MLGDQYPVFADHSGNLNGCPSVKKFTLWYNDGCQKRNFLNGGLSHALLFMRNPPLIDLNLSTSVLYDQNTTTIG